MRLRSKIDGWLMAVMLSSIAMLVGALSMAHLQEGALPLALLVPVLLLGVGLPLWILIGTHYTFVRDELIVRSGPFRWRVPLRDIRSVTPTRDMQSGPALSLDRLRIDYGKGRAVLVSPAEKDAFLQAIDGHRT